MCLSFFQNDVETVDPRGRTPLHLAVSLGHLESVRVLLRHGAQVTKENANNWTGMLGFVGLRKCQTYSKRRIVSARANKT